MATEAQFKAFITKVVQALDSISTPRALTPGEKQAILTAVVTAMMQRVGWELTEP